VADCQNSTNNGTEVASDDIVQQLSWFVMNELRMPAGLIVTVINELERLRALNNSLQRQLLDAVIK
jgi:hypothetical protein